jgi:hypothetical protein
LEVVPRLNLAMLTGDGTGTHDVFEPRVYLRRVLE